MSSDEQHGNQGGWEPTPKGDGYDDGATAFVQLPPDFMLDGVPLEAPGHGYVPPMITPLQPLDPPPTADPAATGGWSVHLPVEAEQERYAEPPPYEERSPYEDQGARPYFEHGRTAEGFEGERDGSGFEYFEQGEGLGRPEYGEHAEHVEQGEYGERAEQAEYTAPQAEYAEPDPHATAEWHFGRTAEPAPGPGATGQWRFPAEAAEEPGGFAEPVAPPSPPSYTEAPPTLPGGAPAPWALPGEPETAGPEAGAVDGTADDAAGAPTDDEDADAVVEPGAAPEDEPDADRPDTAPPFAGADLRAETAPGQDAVPEADTDTDTDTDTAPEADPAPDADAAPDTEPPLAPQAHVHARSSTDSDEHPHSSYTLRVNGVDRPVTGSWIGESLLYVLRERLGLAGAKDGCSQGECGACNVQVDGRLVASCLVPAATAAGSEVRTVEGLAADGEPSDVQRAMARCGTVQCGFCIPGMCMTVHDLLEGNHAPTELETRQALAGNLCRCSGYRGVLQAVRDVVAEREASAAAHASEGADDTRIPHQHTHHPHDGGKA